jgi:two-component system, response regulator
LAESDSLEVLLVEDNPADAELTLRALQKNGAVKNIQHMWDGAEALDFLFCRGNYSDRDAASPPRIVLLDLKLPKIDGCEVLRQIKQDPRTRPIPVIILTSSKEERDLMESYRLGVNSYIQKPVSFAEFQEVVRQLGLYWLSVNTTPPPGSFASK